MLTELPAGQSSVLLSYTHTAGVKSLVEANRSIVLGKRAAPFGCPGQIPTSQSSESLADKTHASQEQLEAEFFSAHFTRG